MLFTVVVPHKSHASSNNQEASTITSSTGFHDILDCNHWNLSLISFNLTQIVLSLSHAFGNKFSNVHNSSAVIAHHDLSLHIESFKSFIYKSVTLFQGKYNFQLSNHHHGFDSSLVKFCTHLIHQSAISFIFADSHDSLSIEAAFKNSSQYQLDIALFIALS
jgi:hypothetical protein